MEELTSSAVLEASVVSTKIGSSWGSADEGLIDAESNTQDNNSTPRIDWDVIVDNCEERGSVVEYHYGKEMNCLPKQLTVSFYGASSQQWFSRLSLEPPCALKNDMLQQWRQHAFSLIFSVKAQPIPFLKLGMVAGNLQDTPSYPSSEDQIQHPEKVD